MAAVVTHPWLLCSLCQVLFDSILVTLQPGSIESDGFQALLNCSFCARNLLVTEKVFHLGCHFFTSKVFSDVPYQPGDQVSTLERKQIVKDVQFSC